MKRDMIGKYLQHFKDVKVEVHVVQMSPLALCNFVAYDLLNKGAGDQPTEEEAGNQKNCVVALDIGADSSNLIITDADRIIWQRPIPLGGNHFTRALTKDLKLTFAKAEHLKRNATKSPDLKKILASLKPVLNDFVGEVQRSLGYFTNTHRDAHVDYMVGLGNAFRLPGLQRFLAEKLQLDVRKLSKLERLTGEVLNSPTYSENILSFAVAYGLAIQGVKQARLVTNLLPGEIRIERMVRAKKPWAVTAAACLLLTSTAMALDTYLEYRSYGDKMVLDAEGKTKSSIDNLAKAEALFKTEQDKANAEERAVRSIVAGQAEQKNWLKITKLIGTLIPQPDGVNFPGKVHDKYWTALASKHKDEGGNTGKHAYEVFKQRLDGLAGVTESGGPGVNDDLSNGIDDLILYNIESVDSRFTTDLAGTWPKIHEALKNLNEDAPENVRPESDFNTPPSGSGWIFELKGYTYHHKKQDFIREGLLENIARLGVAKAAEAKPESAGADASKAAPGTTPTTAAGPKPATPTTAAAQTPATAAKPATPAPGQQTAGQQPAGQKPAAPKTDLKSLEAACNEPFHISHVVLLHTSSAKVYGYGTAGGSLPPELDKILGSSASAGGGGSQPAGGGIPGGGGGGGLGRAAQLDAVARSGQAPTGGSGGGGGGGGWTPLLNPSGGIQAAITGGQPPRGANPGGANSVVGGGPGRFRRGAQQRGGGGEGGDSPINVSRAPAANTAPAQVAAAEGEHVRTDFIILFIWQEPTPSDLLRATGGAKK
jgi:hypothetical protein